MIEINHNTNLCLKLQTLNVLIVVSMLFAFKPCQAQNYHNLNLRSIEPIDSSHSNFKLSDSLNETHMGIWQNGDYDIYVDINTLENYFNIEYQSLVHLLDSQNKNDTATITRIKMYVDRYSIAYNTLKTAEQGFDLKQIVAYIGPNNINQNKGNSEIINQYILNAVQLGNAKVLYKGQRIFNLQIKVYHDRIFTFFKIYYDDINNCIFEYINNVNW